MNLQGLAREALVVSDAQDAAFVDDVAAHGLTESGDAIYPDGKIPKSIEAHDRQHHPGGFDPKKGKCKYRDALAKGDENDDLVPAPFSTASGVAVEMGDITKQYGVDAIVNAANRWMLGGGGVDGAIHRAAGPKLREECEKYPPDSHGYRVQTGEAKITGAGNLPNKFVIHTAGPDVRDYLPPPEPVTPSFSLGNPQAGYESPDLFDLFEDAYGDDEPPAFSLETPARKWNDPANITDEQWEELDTLLGNSYRNSMELAAEHGAKSIAFPSISTGIFGFPVERAAKVAAREIAAFREKHPDVSVKMCIYDPSPVIARNNMQQYQDAFEEAGLAEAEETPAADEASFSPAEYVAGFKKYFGYRDADYRPTRSYREIGDSIAAECAIRAPRDTAAHDKEGDAVIALVLSGDPEGEEAGRNLGDCMMRKGKHDNETLLKRMGEAYKALQSLAVSQEEEAGNADVQDADSDAESTSMGPGSPTDLQKHDAKYHPNGFDPNKDKCKYRENLAKGDEADASLMDPENIEGDDEGAAPPAQNALATLQAAAKGVDDVLSDIDAQVKAGHYVSAAGPSGALGPGYTGPGYGVMELANGLDEYEQAYDQATGTTPGTKALAALGKQIKGGGLTAQLLQAQLAAAKQASAAANLPSGTKTPEEMRNAVALAFAKLLGANLVVAGSEQPSVPAAPAAAPGKQRQNPNIPEEIEDAVSAAGIHPLTFEKKGGNDYYKSLGSLTKPGDDQTAEQIATTIAKHLPKGWVVGMMEEDDGWHIGIGKDGPMQKKVYDRLFESGTGNEITQTASQGATQFGPRASLSIDESNFPAAAAFDFAHYGSGKYTSAGSGSTNPHKITINGDTYYVKQAGNNPSYNNDAARNEVNANKFLRLAGLLAPESKLYTENGVNYCVTKALPHSGKIVTSNLSDPNVEKQLQEAYPVMDLMYNTDILQNDNAYLDPNGEVAFIDNGSSFGTSAQGTRNSKQKFGFDYDLRTDPYSGNPKEDYGALASHPHQAAWKQATSGTDINEQAAKWNLGDLAREAINLGLVPKQAQAAFQQFADAIDDTSDKLYPNLRPGKITATAPQQRPATPATAAPVSPSQQPSPAASSSNPAVSAMMTALNQVANGSWNPPRLATQTAAQFRRTSALTNAIFHAMAQGGANASPQVQNAFKQIVQGAFSPAGRGVGGTVTGANLPRAGIQSLQRQMNAALNPQGLKIQVHNNGNITFSASNSAIANSALKAAGVPTSNTAAKNAPPTSAAPAVSTSTQTTAAPSATNSNFSHVAWLQGIPAASGSTAIHNLQIAPSVPASLTTGLTASGSVLGPGFNYTVTPTATGGYVLGLAPGQSKSPYIGTTSASPLMANSPTVPGYTKSIATNGIVYTPVQSQSSTSAPQSSPPSSTQATPAATPPPATQTPSGNNAGGWRNLMSGLQSAPQSKSLGSAYGTVANWLNNAAKNGQI